MSVSTTDAQQAVEAHFDEVSRDYDYWKKKNPFYYDALHKLAASYTEGAENVLDVGCGTGSMIRTLAPTRALGLDVSLGMIEVARRNNADHPEYEFKEADIVHFTSEEKFDVILFFDVIEHLTDVESALRAIRELLTPEGKFVLSMANPLWEPILMFAEKRGLKMPEGPHYRMPSSELLPLARACGLTLVARQWRLLFPKYIPGFSWLMNDVVGRIPGIRRLSVVEVYVFMRA